jgi:long-chain acyl-CoA synthetase
VQSLISAEIDKANDHLARVEQIKAFRILPRSLQPGCEGEPMTATRKVRRQAMYEQFKDLVESMYDDSEERLIAAHTGEAFRTADVVRGA